MKINLILIITSLLLTACATQAPNWGDMSESDIASWRKADVVVDDVEKFVKENMSARDVLEWKNSEFKVAEDIIAWHRGEFTPGEAKEWKDKGFNVEQAKAWKKNKFTLKDAVTWKSAGFSLEKAIKDREQGLVPNP